jgi:hypothetical protein
VTGHRHILQVARGIQEETRGPQEAAAVHRGEVAGVPAGRGRVNKLGAGAPVLQRGPTRSLDPRNLIPRAGKRGKRKVFCGRGGRTILRARPTKCCRNNQKEHARGAR